MTAAEMLPALSIPEVANEMRIVEESAVAKVTVLGKANCGKCDAAKKKLSDYFRMDFDFVDVAAPGEGWRDTEAAAILADAAVNDIDHTHPPIIGVNGKAYTYADGMKALKALMV